MLSDKEGKFCFMVPPGEYRLTPTILPHERAGGLSFSPEFLDITISNQPMLNVDFAQVSSRDPHIRESGIKTDAKFRSISSYQFE